MIDLLYSMGYIRIVVMVRETETFRAWIKNLRDERAQSRVNIRIR